MNAIKSILISGLFLLIACSDKDSDNTVKIKVIMPNVQAEEMKGRYLYLVNSESKTILDSVIANGDTSIFNLIVDSTFFPHEVAIIFTDSINRVPYKRRLGFKNPYVSKMINSSFYIDRGITTIGTYYNETAFNSTYKGSRQNLPLLKNISLSYATDGANDSLIIQRDVALIAQYPYSFCLLKQLLYYKEKFSIEDLKTLLDHFDKDVKRTAKYKSFENYFQIAETFDKVYPHHLQLQDPHGHLSLIGDEKASFNLLVFWASWCGPCRKEIPTLKKIYDHYNKKGLSISSISLDHDVANWKTALAQEDMPWKQLIATDSSLKQVDMLFNIKLIPKAYLFDKEKKLIRRFDGNVADFENVFYSLFSAEN
ncbi:Thiol-disulfide isomerase or thioredoxin [Hydrobacter penzbergensis]|uniref:Thiol-disulfide isomerase or thioredoxin n=1 Tax=Hydrobacter penzbergensis TaxID=1235997 RepID=A0A8X8IGA1_9BACT|nr:TlpA disulfide reductase family protein [Hydrobacter penzbergensis]SDX27004.1 Thiol-disulfide isomerase or thioredoxin [Hydrobacter penzbergensis]